MSSVLAAEAVRGRAALLLMAASGFAGLALQIVWTRQSALWLGHEAPAVLAVVAAFFGGLALGAWGFGERIERSAFPGRWYAGCELAIAVWSLLLLAAMPALSAALLSFMGAQPSAAWQWSVAFIGTFMLLLPATAAMGATLPAIERAVRQGAAGPTIAGLYASNTAGAVIGVLAGAFWMVPTLGFRGSAMVCVTLNLSCAVVAFRWFGGAPSTSAPVMERRWAPLLPLAVTGLLGIGYEVLVVRVLSQVAEDTVYTFAMLLAVYLVGTAAGAASWQRWHLRRGHSLAEHRLTAALAMACLLGTASLWGAEHVKRIALELFGASMAAALAAEAALAVLAFGLPTFFMGALFSHLAARARADGSSFGRALAVNTLGASLAPFAFGVIAFPLLGPKTALLVIVCGYLALIVRRGWRSPWVWLPGAATLAVALLAPRLAFIDVPDGGRVLSYHDGAMASVSVVEDPQGVARLRIDNRQQEGSSATLRVDARQALLPLMLHTQPRQALFLGLGTGVTASAAARDPALEVEAVELIPEVIEASRYFTRELGAGDANPLRIINADARRFVRATRRQYDVIVADNFHPARSGAGALYTVEHFSAVRARLRADGLFCQWLPLHQLDLETLRSIVQSFLAAFPDGWAMLASNSLETPVVGLVARRDGGRFDPAAVRARLAAATFSPAPAALGIEDEFALLGSFVAGPEALHRFAGHSPLNTDDRPVVAYRAPRITYAPDSAPRDRLGQLLAELDIEPRELVVHSSDEIFTRRLSAYWQARDRFIESGRSVHPSRDVRDMLAQVREPLLAVLRLSPDFRPAYDPLLMMANALANTDSAGARDLLAELAAMQPARDEAQRALAALGGAH
jgi:spermidine synthase